jgi:hypothetical protein
MITGGLEEATFRANPRYELVLLDRLSAEERAYLGGLERETDLYGILRPRDGGGVRFRSACRDTALLFLTLREPGRLPAYVQVAAGEGWRRAVAELVLDDVLEIRVDGAFVSGADAYRWVCDDTPTPVASARLARLSIDALRYAEALDIRDAGRLSARLYFYNRVPASPDWHRRFPTPEAVAQHLGIEDGSVRSVLERQCVRMPSPGPGEGWIMWRSRGAQPLPPGSPLFKLYLSPDPSAAADAFKAAVGVLGDLPVVLLKVGRDVHGLLRPDKIITYFRTREDVEAAGECLARDLGGIPAQGVPFTAEIAGDGLLSWGVDPPRTESLLAWQERESWRLWLTNRLATALLAAQSGRPGGLAPWQFALERLRLLGVDPHSWTPLKTLWSEPAASSADGGHH